MRGPLLPVVLLVLAPAAYFAARLGWLRRPALRWAAAALALAAVLASAPWQGLDFAYLKRINIVLAGAAVAVVALRHWGGPRALSPRAYLAALATLAAACLTVYLNFFAFHGQRTWVHLHDVAHYYLGSKYFDELGYEHLYTAMLRAEAELAPGRFSTREARDLATNELVPIRELLLRSDEVKAAFAPARWQDWKRDVALFRDALGPQFQTLYADHGFNPTPLWPLLGGTLARMVPAGSGTGVLLLTLLDPLLLAAAFLVVGRTFGAAAALLGVIHFCLIYGASFGWTGGAFLRYAWFAALLGALCALPGRRLLLAGGLLGLAATLRVFPVLFAVPLVLQALPRLWRERRLAAEPARLLGGMAAAGLALFLATALQPRGLAAWDEFRVNMAKHMDTISPNVMGLTPALAYHHTPELLTLEELRAERERRALVNRVQLATVFVAVLLAVALLARRADVVEAFLLGVPLILSGLNLASYYYVLLVVLVVAWWDRPARVIALLAFEMASHLLLLFEEREAFLYMQRSLILFYVLAAIYLDPLREAWRDWRAPAAGAAGSA